MRYLTAITMEFCIHIVGGTEKDIGFFHTNLIQKTVLLLRDIKISIDFTQTKSWIGTTSVLYSGFC